MDRSKKYQRFENESCKKKKKLVVLKKKSFEGEYFLSRRGNMMENRLE